MKPHENRGEAAKDFKTRVNLTTPPAHICDRRASEPKNNVRNRYVSQVLLATFGFGVLLGVIAVVQTPADWSRQGTHASSRPADSSQCQLSRPPTPCAETAPRVHQSNGDCDFPARLMNN